MLRIFLGFIPYNIQVHEFDKTLQYVTLRLILLPLTNVFTYCSNILLSSVINTYLRYIVVYEVFSSE
ncbi:unnamed protein product [Adineta ricciae]|uniref:Uncharacterized protein n=1 Tax=Adineta ricciae TaxID=249248 RepID=A0A815WAH5_ADIRI|nr:unnamed protein product [Adineta ricciae]